MDIKVGVICPDRGDRPQFMGQFHRQLEQQTIKPEIVEIVDYAPTSDVCDITARYRVGYDNLRNKGLDVIAFFENDDIYLPDYLETMVNGWASHGKPKMFGLDYTIYYHLCVGKSFMFKHDKRSSMMSTLMQPDLDFEWCDDSYAYTDSHLWKTVGGKTWNPHKLITMGLKHGIGKSGGQWHIEGLQRYKDAGISLKKVVGEENYNFYRTLYPPTAQLVRDKSNGLTLVGI